MSPPVQTADFPLLSRNVTRSVILGAMKAMSLSLFENDFIYWNIIMVGEIVSTESIIYFWSLIILL